MKIEFTPGDFEEGADLYTLSLKIDQIDYEYVDRITDEMMQYQPFLLSAMLGFKDDVNQDEHWEIMKMYFLFWEYFKRNQKVRKRQVTKEMFEKSEETILQMLIYSEGEYTEHEKGEIFAGDINRIKSKGLWAAIHLRFYNNPVLEKMGMKMRGIILIGLRSFIECFEAL